MFHCDNFLNLLYLLKINDDGELCVERLWGRGEFVTSFSRNVGHRL